MATITGAVESFTADITHTPEGTAVEFVLTVTDDASGFDIGDDITISSDPSDAPAATKPENENVVESPAGTFSFSIAFPTVSRSTIYTITAVASGVVGLSSNKSIKISVLKDISITHILNHPLNFPVSVKGSNISEVDVQGLLQPLYHHWDATAGIVYIRSAGNVDTLYKDLSFTISVQDSVGSAQIGGVLNVQQPAPAIRLPTKPLKFVFGEENEADLQIDNKPSKVDVIGTWLNLTATKNSTGVKFKGNIPEYGDETGEMTAGVNSGSFFVVATNSGNEPVHAEVPWILVQGKPIFRDSSFTKSSTVNEAVTDTISVDGDPQPTIVVESGSLPTGLALSTAYEDSSTTISFTGTATQIGSFKFKLKASNALGISISGEFTINISIAMFAPTIKRKFSGQTRLSARRHFPYNVNRFFNRGVPEGVYSLGPDTDSPFSISDDGEVSFSSARLGVRYRLHVVLTNSEGSVEQKTWVTLRV